MCIARIKIVLYFELFIAVVIGNNEKRLVIYDANVVIVVTYFMKIFST